MQNIDSIIFDLGGVILDISFERTKAAFEKLGIAHFEKMYSLKDANQLFQRLEKGELNEAEFYDAFRQSSGTNLSDDEIKVSWNALLLDFRPATLAALERLKRK